MCMVSSKAKSTGFILCNVTESKSTGFILCMNAKEARYKVLFCLMPQKPIVQAVWFDTIRLPAKTEMEQATTFFR